MRTLFAKGEDANAKANDGRSALEIATDRGVREAIGHDAMRAQKWGRMQKVPTVALRTLSEFVCKLLKGLEARAGIEPAHKGFADLSLTTWVPRLGRAA